MEGFEFSTWLGACRLPTSSSCVSPGPSVRAPPRRVCVGGHEGVLFLFTCRTAVTWGLLSGSSEN